MNTRKRIATAAASLLAATALTLSAAGTVAAAPDDEHGPRGARVAGFHPAAPGHPGPATPPATAGGEAEPAG